MKKRRGNIILHHICPFQPLIRPSNESSPIKPRPATVVEAAVASPFLKTHSEPSLLLRDSSPSRTHPGGHIVAGNESAGGNIFDLIDNLSASNLVRITKILL